MMEATSPIPMTLLIDPVPAFQDNYIWLLHQSGSPHAWAVDPGDAAPLLIALQQRGLQFAGVLITHHHPDHDSGVPALSRQFPGLRVIGGLQGKSKHLTERLPDGGGIDILGHHFQLLELPGHTLDHVAFYCEAESALFCGDTLFTGGCGRLFEGTARQLQDSLGRIARLAPTTRVFCAHEYTLSNLRFARVVEPMNEALMDREQKAQALRARGEPTVPSTLGLELATNPFLRCHEPRIMAAVREQSGDELVTVPDTFAALRKWKDHF